MRLLLMGFGNVGRGLASLIQDQHDALMKQYGCDLQIVGVATGTRGIVYHPDGLAIDGLLSAYDAGDLTTHPAQPTIFDDPQRMIETAAADILVEATPTKFDTAQPAYDYMQSALNTGKHVISANKGPIARYYPQLTQRARAQGLYLRYEATVMAGTPAIATGTEMLAGAGIREVRGILNGTTNYILTQMEGGQSYADALAQAQALGYAEADPSGDVDGWDAAGKVLILAAAIFGKSLNFDDLTVTGITQITPQDIRTAQAEGARYKLIASVDAEGGAVRPVRLPMTDPLAQVSDATNAITYRTDALGDVTLIGAVAGRRDTGYGVLADILAIQRQLA